MTQIQPAPACIRAPSETGSNEGKNCSDEKIRCSCHAFTIFSCPAVHSPGRPSFYKRNMLNETPGRATARTTGAIEKRRMVSLRASNEGQAQTLKPGQEIMSGRVAVD